MTIEKDFERVAECRKEIAWLYMRMHTHVANGNEFGISEIARQMLKLTSEIVCLLYPGTIQAVEAKENNG